MGDSILNALIQDLSKQHNVRITKFPRVTLCMISIIMYIQSFAENRNKSLSTEEQMIPPVQHLGKLSTHF